MSEDTGYEWGIIRKLREATTDLVVVELQMGCRKSRVLQDAIKRLSEDL